MGHPNGAMDIRPPNGVHRARADVVAGSASPSSAPLKQNVFRLSIPKSPASSFGRVPNGRGGVLEGGDESSDDESSPPPDPGSWREREADGFVSAAYADEFKSRRSADIVRREILACYKLVNKLKRGAVYLGSSRIKSTENPKFRRAFELAKEVATLLRCTTWTGAGPGMMDAACLGAMKAGRKVGGFKINKEVGCEWEEADDHPYLPAENLYTTRFFSARKMGLVDAGVRVNVEDKTAYIVLPGGLGTLDEAFEIITLMQLNRLGSSYPVPFLLMNYDGCYNGLFQFLEDCHKEGTVTQGEVDRFWHVCSSNEEALSYLADFYGIPEEAQTFRGRLNEGTAPLVLDFEPSW